MFCILCLKVSTDVIKIFEQDGIRLDVSSIVMLHFSIQPSPENPNNDAVCVSCWNELNNFHKFYKKVEQAHSNLINTWAAAATEKSDILSTAINIAGINQDQDDEETDLESTSTEEDEYFGDESVNDDFELRQSPSLDLDEVIHKHMKLSCYICHKSVYNFYMLRRHFESVHDEKCYVMCCNHKFKRRTLLANHIYLEHHLADFHDKDNSSESIIESNDGCLNNCVSSINVTNSVTLHFKKSIKSDKLHETLNALKHKHGNGVSKFGCNEGKNFLHSTFVK